MAGSFVRAAVMRGEGCVTAAEHRDGGDAQPEITHPSSRITLLIPYQASNLK
jgi:hypothetical protein